MDTIEILPQKFISLHDIVLMQADINYTELHFVNGEVLLLSKTIKFLLDRFEGYSFFRISKKNVINLRYLQDTCRKYSFVTLQNNRELTVSRRRREDFKNTVIQYISIGVA